jgi:hypothetical protein
MRDLLVHPKIHLAEIEERIEKSLLRALSAAEAALR